MVVNKSAIALTGTELGLAATLLTSTWVTLGTLPFNPVIIIFDNQSTAPVAISTNGGSTIWHTFPAGEAIILDLRGNHGVADNYTFSLGTTFSGMGTTSTGFFSISYVYAQPQ